MTKITLGKEHYHLQREYTDWCRNNIGHDGGWIFSTENPLSTDVWNISSIFGRTTMHFRYPEDAERFAEKFCD